MPPKLITKWQRHCIARPVSKSAKSSLRNYIITELVALLTSPLHIPRTTIIAFIQSLKASPYVEVVHIDVSLDAAAWRLLTNREDKQWSLVDCSSFVVMQRYGLREALTADHHFEQAGFMRLLKL